MPSPNHLICPWVINHHTVASLTEKQCSKRSKHITERDQRARGILIRKVSYWEITHSDLYIKKKKVS